MRIRTIKPEFFLHEGLFDLERETGLPIRVAFAGLWCVADREGRFRWEPRKLKAQILPYDDVDFSRVLDALTTRGSLVRYASRGVDYGWIPSFHKHQFLNPREKASELPEPPENSGNEGVDASATRAPRVPDACPTRLSLPNIYSTSLPNKEKGSGEKPIGATGAKPETRRASGIPGDEKEAVEWAGMEMVPAEFARDVFLQCEGVNWLDGSGRSITNWRAYIKSRFSRSQKAQPAGGANSSGKGNSVMDLKTKIAIKEEKAKGLRDRFYTESPLGGSWASPEFAREWKGLRREIQELKDQIEKGV